jgi:hypothetical protein
MRYPTLGYQLRSMTARPDDCGSRCGEGKEGDGRGSEIHYEVERLSMAGHWLKPSGKSGKKYKSLSDAQLEAAAVRGRGSVVCIVQVADDGSREVVETNEP